MKKIPVEKIESGMVLGRNVCCSSGSTLLIKGVCLTTALGRRLKNWGITSIYIEGEEDTPQEHYTSSISVNKLKEHLTHKFSHVIHNAVMKKIFSAVYQHRLQKSR